MKKQITIWLEPGDPRIEQLTHLLFTGGPVRVSMKDADTPPDPAPTDCDTYPEYDPAKLEPDERESLDRYGISQKCAKCGRVLDQSKRKYIDEHHVVYDLPCECGEILHDDDFAR